MTRAAEPRPPVLAIGALGGTIAMTTRPLSSDGGGVVPSLTADHLVAAVPLLADEAVLRVETLAALPSPSLDESLLLRALAWAQAQVDAGAAGVVLTQGTDTLEESAFLLDLFWDRPEPLVLTGAMRSPQAPGADGPANLLAAARTARAAASRDRGVLVVIDDEIHAARWVAKTDSMATGAFTSPGFGPIGRHVETTATYAAAAVRSAPMPSRVTAADRQPRVPLLTTHLGDDGFLMAALDPTQVDAVVVAGFGAGHVSTAMAQRIGELAAQVPVVFCSRTGAGPTARAVYGYPGSEIDLQQRGAIGAGWLSPLKARLLLWALASAGPLDREDVAAAFAVRGAL